MPLAAPTAFISYAHEGDLQQQIKKLADWLTTKGIQVVTDHPYANRPPEQGWRAWMQHNVEDADIVLIVCTERYKRLFEKRAVPDGGYGVSWESAMITDDLYQAKMRNTRFFPILPDGADAAHVPCVLRDWNNNHRFPSGYDRILGLIQDEKVTSPPEATSQQGWRDTVFGRSDQGNHRRYWVVAGVLLVFVLLAVTFFRGMPSGGIQADGDVIIGNDNVINSGSGDIIQHDGQ